MSFVKSGVFVPKIFLFPLVGAHISYGKYTFVPYKVRLIDGALSRIFVVDVRNH